MDSTMNDPLGDDVVPDQHEPQGEDGIVDVDVRFSEPRSHEHLLTLGAYSHRPVLETMIQN